MIASRVKPKLSLSISAVHNSSRSAFSIKSPVGVSTMSSSCCTPISPSTTSQTGNMNARTFSSLQQMPTTTSYAYTNTSSSSKSILKKHQHQHSQHQPVRQQTATRRTDKRIQFMNSPTVYCVTPIENKEEYYGTYTKLSREERRWMVREY